MTIGYHQPLYILPFDHCSSFEKGLFGWTGALDAQQTEKIAQSQQVIYDAFKLAVSKGVPRENGGILVDAQFGAAILQDASKNGYITCMPVEKSGQAEFQFEYGQQYEAEIEKFQPVFLKALVQQMDRIEGDQTLYDQDLRPSLMMGAIKELQNAGVEPDVWKIEGLDNRGHCRPLPEVDRGVHGNREQQGCTAILSTKGGAHQNKSSGLPLIARSTINQ
jgi:myo-inositol catabolism protein IolC